MEGTLIISKYPSFCLLCALVHMILRYNAVIAFSLRSGQSQVLDTNLALGLGPPNFAMYRAYNILLNSLLYYALQLTCCQRLS